MKRSEGLGVATMIAALVILGILMVFLAIPGISGYLPGTLIGLGSLVAVLFLGIGLLGKE